MTFVALDLSFEPHCTTVWVSIHSVGCLDWPSSGGPNGWGWLLYPNFLVMAALVALSPSSAPMNAKTGDRATENGVPTATDRLKMAWGSLP